MKAKKFTFLLTVALLLLSAILFTACEDTPGGDDSGVYNITCYMNGTTEAPTTYEATDGVLTLPSLPARTGYTFDGLYDAPEGGSMVMDSNGNCVVVFNRAMTLYARWTPKTYSIVFDGQGGDVPSDEAEMSILYGSAVTKLPTATMDGYTFVGWEDVNGNRVSNGISVLRDKQTFNTDNYTLDGETVRLYAAYEVAKYTVVFDYNDGTYRTVDITVEHGQSIPNDVYPTEGLDSGNKRVSGWGLSPDATQPFMGTVKNNITLYAIWKDYRTFILNDTVGNETSIYVYRDETFDLFSYDEVSRPGYSLDGWYTSGAYSGNPVTEIRYDSADKTYYAKWSVATYTLVFDQESAGKYIDPMTYQMGDTTALESVQREGLTFRGWSVASDGSGEVFTSLPETLYGNYTLYAIYEPAYFDIILWSDGGTLPTGKSVITVEYTKSYELPTPVKEGFIFLGWFDGAEDDAARLTDDTGIALEPYGLVSSSTAYAHWTPVTYTVTFDSKGGSSISPMTVNHGDKLVFPEDPTLNGMIFTGWYNEDMTETFGTSCRVTSDVTLYANWIISNPISTADELKLIATNPDANYHLTCDINLGSNEWTPIEEFRGIFDGKGYKIHNFSISTTASAGLIITNKGTIQNLDVSDFNITATSTWFDVSAVAAANIGTIRNCNVTDGVITVNASSSVDGSGYVAAIGAVCGGSSGMVDGCTAEIAISVNGSAYNPEKWYDCYMTYSLYIGGLVGQSTGTIINSSASSTLTASAWAGGVAGPGGAGSVAECYLEMGGLVGRNSGTCEKSFGNGSTTFSSASYGFQGRIYTYVGGLVGNNFGHVQQCSAKGLASILTNLTGSSLGGLAGYNRKTIMNSYADTYLKSNSSVCGGFVGININNITNCYSLGTLEVITEGTARGGFAAQNNQGGNINKCFAAGNMIGGTTANTDSFVASSETGSSCFKHYYSAEMAVYINDIPASPATLNGEAVSSDTIKTEAFLYETLAWESDIWRIPTEGYPILVWQD